MAMLLCLMVRKAKDPRNLLVLIFGTVLLTAGLCEVLHLSLILTHMILGLIVVNTQAKQLVERLHNQMMPVMPLLFVSFFALAGANLHINQLPSLGLLGLVYVICRTSGLMGGAWIGARVGKLEEKIQKYLGMGILSQAGVAIGLALIVKSEFGEYGEKGDALGVTVLTSVTATCIFFELIGPILTKIALTKAGEIKET